MNEIWRDIPGFEGIYEASNFGNIVSLKHEQRKILKQPVNGGGYKGISLCLNGIQSKFSSHVIICLTFNGPKPMEGVYVVNHKNGNKLDNRPENLEWVSMSLNSSHSITYNKKNGFIAHRSKLTPETVLYIYNKLLLGTKVVRLAEQFNVDRHIITAIKYRKIWGYLLKDLPKMVKRSPQQGIKKHV